MLEHGHRVGLVEVTEFVQRLVGSAGHRVKFVSESPEYSLFNLGNGRYQAIGSASQRTEYLPIEPKQLLLDV
ncbi:hypothetical protein D3C87_2131990 [compost metagenome]